MCVMTPGPDQYSGDKADQARLAADGTFLVNVDRQHYPNELATDAEGRLTMISLIPGALYRIIEFYDVAKGSLIRKDFTVRPGEMLDLGDILIEKPEVLMR